jgi:hypothetical protein
MLSGLSRYTIFRSDVWIQSPHLEFLISFPSLFFFSFLFFILSPTLSFFSFFVLFSFFLLLYSRWAQFAVMCIRLLNMFVLHVVSSTDHGGVRMRTWLFRCSSLHVSKYSPRQSNVRPKIGIQYMIRQSLCFPLASLRR